MQAWKYRGLMRIEQGDVLIMGVQSICFYPTISTPRLVQAAFCFPIPMTAAFRTCHTIPIVNSPVPVPYTCGRSPVSVNIRPNSATGPANRPLCLAYAATRSFPLVTPPWLLSVKTVGLEGEKKEEKRRRTKLTTAPKIPIPYPPELFPNPLHALKLLRQLPL